MVFYVPPQQCLLICVYLVYGGLCFASDSTVDSTPSTAYSQCAAFSAINTNYAGQNYVTCEIVICPGQTMTSSLCNIFSGSPYIRLFQDSTEVAMSGDYCAQLSYTPPALTLCTTFSLRQGCYSFTSCTGTTEVTIVGPDAQLGGGCS
jgi:hypothetical protein